MSKGTTAEVQCAKCIVQGAKCTPQIPWGGSSLSSLDVVVPLIESSSSDNGLSDLTKLPSPQPPFINSLANLCSSSGLRHRIQQPIAATLSLTHDQTT